MDKSMIKGIAVGGLAMVVLGAGAVTGYRSLTQPAHADVLAVTEARQMVTTPQQKCEQVMVKRQAPVQDEHRVAGTVLGGVVGGVLGNQIGGGPGKQVATVVGAAAGAYGGNQIQKNMQQSDVTTAPETRCKTVEFRGLKQVGYDVTYRYQGQERTVRMDHHPGRKIPMRDGKPVLDKPDTHS